MIQSPSLWMLLHWAPSFQHTNLGNSFSNPTINWTVIFLLRVASVLECLSTCQALGEACAVESLMSLSGRWSYSDSTQLITGHIVLTLLTWDLESTSLFLFLTYPWYLWLFLILLVITTNSRLSLGGFLRINELGWSYLFLWFLSSIFILPPILEPKP